MTAGDCRGQLHSEKRLPAVAGRVQLDGRVVRRPPSHFNVQLDIEWT